MSQLLLLPVRERNLGKRVGDGILIGPHFLVCGTRIVGSDSFSLCCLIAFLRRTRFVLRVDLLISDVVCYRILFAWYGLGQRWENGLFEPGQTTAGDQFTIERVVFEPFVRRSNAQVECVEA